MPAPWEKDYSSDIQSSPDQKPWEKDYSSHEGDFWHPVKPEPGSGWRGVLERLGQYPRIAVGDILDAGETLGRVSRGEIDATSPEAAGAAATIVPLLSGVSPATGTGAAVAKFRGLGKVANPGDINPAYVGPTAGMVAAQTGVDVGSPLPAGVVSNTPGVQVATQGSRRLPIVGQGIEEGVANTVKATGNRVNQIAEDLGGGAVPDRPTAGADTRTALEGVIEDNNQKIDSLYDDLRDNHIKANLFSSTANTKAVLKDIGAKRWTAGEDRASGLANIERLISSGKPFDGLIRARSRVGTDIGANFKNPNPGFPTADMERLYGAISKDIQNAVTSPNNLRPGVTRLQAMEAFNIANNTAKELIDKNASIQKILNIRNDEGVIGSIVNMTKNKRGDARLLGELLNQLPGEASDKLRSIWLHELGDKPSMPGGYSLNQLASRYNDTNPTIKSIMVKDPAHRKALDDIAKLGDFLKDADKYVNHSATSGGNAMSLFIGALAGGKWKEALAGLAGGYTFGQILARPASASALRKWLTIARDKASGRYGPVRSAKAEAAMSIATRNLLNNLPEPAQAGPQKREPLRVHVPLADKVQSRVAPSVGF